MSGAELAAGAPFRAALAELVALDTVSPMPPAALAECERLLGRWGCRRVGTGLFVRGHLDAPVWLYSHVDTKPAKPLERWTTDPWQLTGRGGRLVGLGVSDAKFQLLTALAVADDERHCVVVDTCEETDGCADAAALISGRQPDTLLVCDGGMTDEHDVFNGMLGQADGHLTLDTGEPRRHPARSPSDVLELCADLAARAGKLPAKFTLTGIEAEPSVSSLSLQRLEVRFDIRFAQDARADVERFLADYRYRPRHATLHPVWGREILRLDERTSVRPAPFSTRFAGPDWRPPRRCLVVAGAHRDNGNHQPGEFIRISQIDAYRTRLAGVLAALDDDREPRAEH